MSSPRLFLGQDPSEKREERDEEEEREGAEEEEEEEEEEEGEEEEEEDNVFDDEARELVDDVSSESVSSSSSVWFPFSPCKIFFAIATVLARSLALTSIHCVMTSHWSITASLMASAPVPSQSSADMSV